MSPTTDDITAGAEAIAKADGWTDREITSRSMGPLQWQSYEAFAAAALGSQKASSAVESQEPTDLEVMKRIASGRVHGPPLSLGPNARDDRKMNDPPWRPMTAEETRVVEQALRTEHAAPLHVDNRVPIWRTYVARAEENDRGRGFVGKYAFPGGALRIVYAAGENIPAIFATAEAAENEARRVLVESLNARYRTTESRNVISKKLTGDEFAVELAAVDITPSEWAQMWGTKQDTVVAQIQGEKEVPFAARWILPVLRSFAGALERAQEIVAENTTVKPEWLERKRKRVENQEGR